MISKIIGKFINQQIVYPPGHIIRLLAVNLVAWKMPHNNNEIIRHETHNDSTQLPSPSPPPPPPLLRLPQSSPLICKYLAWQTGPHLSAKRLSSTSPPIIIWTILYPYCWSVDKSLRTSVGKGGSVTRSSWIRSKSGLNSISSTFPHTAFPMFPPYELLDVVGIPRERITCRRGSSFVCNLHTLIRSRCPLLCDRY